MSLNMVAQFAQLSNKDTDGRGQLIRIGDWVENSEDNQARRQYMVTTAGMHIAVFNVGYPHTTTTFNSYILQLPNGDFSIYKPRQWNHLCHAWTSGGRSSIMLVSINIPVKFININFFQSYVLRMESFSISTLWTKTCLS